MSGTRNAAAQDRLALEVARSLAMLGDQPADWVPERAGLDHDVAVIGAGHSGLAIAHALHRAGITRVTVLDAAPEGRAGVWRNNARMATLRTPKSMSGPENGLPALTFQAWYEAGHGAAAYAALGRIPTEDWAAYLDWYRAATGIAVRAATRLLRIVPEAGLLRLDLDAPEGPRTERVRKLVLATGLPGGGAPSVPPVISEGLPKALYSHTDESIDFAAFRGRRIGILGAASAAFDAAATALEAGAEAVHLFCRHADLERATPLKTLSYPGAFEHFHALPDADRWRLMRRFRARAPGPTLDTVRRAARFANFHLHLGESWISARPEGGHALVETAQGRYGFDHVLAGTGHRVDLRLRPELAGFADRIATWGERFAPPPGEGDAVLAGHPYLDAGFAFQEKEPGTAPFLADIHFFGTSGLVSHGRPVGDTGSLKHNVPRLVSAIGRGLFLADRPAHLDRLSAVAEPDLTGEEYAGALWSGAPVTLP